MLKIHARELIKYTPEQLWGFLQGEFIVKFDDDEIQTNYKEVIYSSYVWRYHQLYPNTPILLKHHVKSILKNERLNDGTHLKLIANNLYSVYDAYCESVADRVNLLDDLAKIAYEITNQMYNDLTYRLEEYVTSIDILDLLEITEDPAHLEIMNSILPTQGSIAECYNKIESRIKDANYFPNNAFVKAVKSKILNLRQVIQVIGPRGFLTDIDSHLFKKPVTVGYTQGIRSLYDIMVESRSSAKALAFSTDPLQQSEYFSRRQQLICQNVETLHPGDCGSTHYLSWHVRSKVSEDGFKINDLDTICGKYYLDEETNTLKIIKKTDTHLINKTIKLRSPVAGCAHPDPQGICETCFGEAYLAIPKGTNLGHMACTFMTEKISQMVLSIKHVDGSSAVEGIVLKPHEKKYLKADINGNVYFLSDELKNKELKLMINANDAVTLTDINLVDDVDKLNISRVSELDSIVFVASTDVKGETPTIQVSVNKRLANMTHAFLKHIKEVGWGITDKGFYVIDMKGWDFKLPILSLPLRHFNMSNHQVEIAEMLEATVKDLTYRDNVVAPSAMLIEFHDLVNKRLPVNLAVLETIIYASMVVSAANGDYSLPKAWTDSGVGVMRLLLNNRSLAPAMAYERHKETINSTTSYTHTNRPEHCFDWIIMPSELQQEENRRRNQH